MGSNMAECHPVGFQWVMEAKRRGAEVIHVDPRFTRTSAVASSHVQLRAGSDLAFLGGIIHHILENGRDFREYVLEYTNAPVIVDDRFLDTEDLDGLFSGWDPEKKTYDTTTWQYEGMEVAASAGQRELGAAAGEQAGHGGHGSTLHHGEPPSEDPTLEHPRCVYQLLRKHFRRYTPEFVEQTCGVPRDQFLRVADALCDNSGRERTSAIVYSVGWTQHTVGVQYIRAASIVQLLLGNIGRPGGGILALRGHASIQGSTDIPTLYNILPGYIPMPHVHAHQDLRAFVESNAAPGGFWGNMEAYTVSLLKAYWGDKATAENDYCFDYLPRISGDHSIYASVLGMLDGTVDGMIVAGQNPAVGSANSRLHRFAMAELDWLVVRDLFEVETASFWKDGPEIERGELRTEDIGTEVFFMPAAAHTEKDGSFTNTQRLLQWHHKAVEPPRRLPLGAVVLLPPGPHHPREAGRIARRHRPSRARPAVGLPDHGRDRRAKRRGRAPRDQRQRPRRRALRLHRPQGGRLHLVRLLDLLRRVRRRDQPGRPPRARDRSRRGWRRSGDGRGRRTGASSTTAPPPTQRAGPGRSASATCGGTSANRSGRATTCPTSSRPSALTTCRLTAPRPRT